MKDVIRIASGQGFWGDLQRAPIDQARRGPIDYLVMDYLAEVTMSIMQKQKLRSPELGYAVDFVAVVTELLPDIREKGFKIISNAGGVNPIACAKKIIANARELAKINAARLNSYTASTSMMLASPGADPFAARVMAMAKLMMPARALKTPKIASARTKVDLFKTGW